MSFQDVGRLPPRRPSFTPSNGSRQNSHPFVKVRVVPSPSEEKDNVKAKKKKKHPALQEGRVVVKNNNENDAPDVSFSSVSSSGEEARGKRHESTFSKLTHETQQFQKLVADLELALSKAGESPEAAWRARILIRSAQDADSALCDKLLEYEKSLLPSSKQQNRTVQLACVKLHRDFKRSHKMLVMCLTLYERKQQAEVSQLGAVGYTTTNTNLNANNKAEDDGDDFFDRAMRQKEIERMNVSMHKVNNIYKELAFLVESQQDDINHLEDEIEIAAANVESAADEIHCYGRRHQLLLCGAMGEGVGGCASLSSQPETFDATVSYSDEQFQSTRQSRTTGMRVDENFHWTMPFQTLKEDMTSVRQDIVGLGKGLVTQGQDISKRLECGAVESTIE